MLSLPPECTHMKLLLEMSLHFLFLFSSSFFPSPWQPLSDSVFPATTSDGFVRDSRGLVSHTREMRRGPSGS